MHPGRMGKYFAELDGVRDYNTFNEIIGNGVSIAAKKLHETIRSPA